MANAVADLLNCDAFTENIFYSNRLKTFTTAGQWPHQKFTNLTAEKMALAGFYFDPDEMNTDNVSCPFCLRSLTGWEEQDEPFTEHAKRKECYFTHLNKDEKDWTVEDFLKLLAQRRASIMCSIALKAIDGAKHSMENVSKRIGVLAENVKPKKSAKAKKKK